MPDPWIEIHPRKVEELGIKEGDMVMVTFGWGNPYAGPEPPINVLAPDDIRYSITGGNSNRCFLVNVAKKT